MELKECLSFFEKKHSVCFEKHLRFNKALGTFWNRSRVNGIQWEQFQAEFQSFPY